MNGWMDGWMDGETRWRKKNQRGTDLVLQESPKGVLWSVGELVVEVNEGSFDLRQGLELLLQGLPDVVGLSEWHLRRQHDVHLHEVVGAERVGSDSVDVPYGLVVVPAQVRQLLQVVRRRRAADQRVDVFQHRR